MKTAKRDRPTSRVGRAADSPPVASLASWIGLADPVGSMPVIREQVLPYLARQVETFARGIANRCDDPGPMTAREVFDLFDALLMCVQLLRPAGGAG